MSAPESGVFRSRAAFLARQLICSPVLPSVLHDFALRVRKANLPRACFYFCHLSCHQPQRTSVANTNIILTPPRHRALPGLQPSCPRGTHRVTLTIRHPRRSKHRTHRTHFARQEPPRCGCKGHRCARPGAGGRIREEARHSKGLRRSRRISTYVCGAHSIYPCHCTYYQVKNYWTIPKLMSCTTPYVRVFSHFD